MIEKLYSSNHLDDSFPIPTESDVLALEKRIGVRLPAAYRNFVLERNGGTFDDVVIPFPDGKSDVLDFLYGINTNTDYAELGDDINVFEENFPAKLLPIGYTGMGTMVLMYVGGSPEDGEGGICIQTSFSMEFVDLASTFNDFIKLLRFG